MTRAEADKLFDELDPSSDGFIEYDEMKKALHKFTKLAEARVQAAKAKAAAAAAATAPSKAPPKLPPPLFPELPEGEDGGELVLQPSGSHTHTIIMLHSMHSVAEMYSRLYRRFGPLAVGFKFVFPRAPQRTLVALSGNERVHGAWFSTTARCEDGTVQPGIVAINELDAQTARIHAILDREAALLGGDTARLVLGGSHQGGSVALHVAMGYKAALGAIVCLRGAPLPNITTIANNFSKTPLFVFAAELDAVLPIKSLRESFEGFTSAGYAVEWHIEPELTHAADSPNEQRFLAYWVARICLGAKQGAFLKQALHVLRKKPPPQRSPRPRQRAVSARPARADEMPAETGFVHSLNREPDWRRPLLNGPTWDNSAAPGFAAPFSPMFSRRDALLSRIDRGGPMLGRVIPSRGPDGRIVSTKPDLLGDARNELANAAARGAKLMARPATARPEWNDNTSPRFSSVFDPSHLFAVGVSSSRRPATTNGLGSPRVPRPTSPRVTLSKHPFGKPVDGVADHGFDPMPPEQRPVTSPGVARKQRSSASAIGESDDAFPPAPPVGQPMTAGPPSPRARQLGR